MAGVTEMCTGVMKAGLETALANVNISAGTGVSLDLIRRYASLEDVLLLAAAG